MKLILKTLPVFLVSIGLLAALATPPSERHRGVGYLEGRGVVSR